MKKGFTGNIERLTEDNDDFRRVLYTGHHIQLVVMALRPGEEIGEEVHDDGDQFFRVEAGQAEVTIDGAAHTVGPDEVAIVPAGARHNVRNVGGASLKLYTIYGPPEHRDGVVHPTKAEADASHEQDHFDGKATE